MQTSATAGAHLFSIDQIRKLHEDLHKQEDPCKCKNYHGDNYWCPLHGHGRD